MISAKSPLVEQVRRFVGANVIRQVTNVVAGLVISALKEKPAEMGEGGGGDGNGGRQRGGGGGGGVALTNEESEEEAH